MYWLLYSTRARGDTGFAVVWFLPTFCVPLFRDVITLFPVSDSARCRCPAVAFPCTIPSPTPPPTSPRTETRTPPRLRHISNSNHSPSSPPSFSTIRTAMCRRISPIAHHSSVPWDRASSVSRRPLPPSFLSWMDRFRSPPSNDVARSLKMRAKWIWRPRSGLGSSSWPKTTRRTVGRWLAPSNGRERSEIMRMWTRGPHYLNFPRGIASRSTFPNAHRCRKTSWTHSGWRKGYGPDLRRFFVFFKTIFVIWWKLFRQIHSKFIFK